MLKKTLELEFDDWTVLKQELRDRSALLEPLDKKRSDALKRVLGSIERFDKRQNDRGR